MPTPTPLDTLLFDHKDFAYLTGCTFRGLSISEGGVYWNIVVRAFGASGEPLYAMTQHEDAREGLQILLGALGTRKGGALWHRDRYYKDHS